MSSNQAWYQFPIGSKFGQTDSEGNYWQPDINLEAPGNYPITNLLPMTVTSVRQTSWGQTVVTGRLDSPLNSLATDQFYEHLSSASVSVGQHLSPGDLVGYNNPQGSVPIGYGLYPGDVYGSGSGWDLLQKDLAPGGAGLLNPTSIIQSFASNGSGAGVSYLSSTGSSGSTTPAISWGPIGQKAGLFILGLAMLLIGLYVLFQSQIDSGVKKAFSGAKKAAEVAAV